MRTRELDARFVVPTPYRNAPMWSKWCKVKESMKPKALNKHVGRSTGKPFKAGAGDTQRNVEINEERSKFDDTIENRRKEAHAIGDQAYSSQKLKGFDFSKGSF